ncbi:uncharacterized protein LOC122577552 [Bombus pyrosoma]|uniref:uncharacterized protein LOC122577552 n=1 Tax=Bombus pyrosoma TaxID=396416 RepID=UPI001CB8D1D8|nr:uncharacterized protein LOC122577552 [Bombus pyrosoma]
MTAQVPMVRTGLSGGNKTNADVWAIDEYSQCISQEDKASAGAQVLKEDAGDGPGSVVSQVGGLRGGPLVPLCAQAKPMDLRREKDVEKDHDRLGIALEVQHNLAILAAKIEPQ